jgi:hypothetical protein
LKALSANTTLMRTVSTSLIMNSLNSSGTVNFVGGNWIIRNQLSATTINLTNSTVLLQGSMFLFVSENGQN